jgi:hypothetical protein
MTADNLSEVQDNGDMRTLCRKIIHQTIRDLGKGHGKDFHDASDYVYSPLFREHQEKAEYPDEMRDCLLELMVCSQVERNHISRSVLALLETVWGK